MNRHDQLGPAHGVLFSLGIGLVLWVIVLMVWVMAAHAFAICSQYPENPEPCRDIAPREEILYWTETDTRLPVSCIARMQQAMREMDDALQIKPYQYRDAEEKQRDYERESRRITHWDNTMKDCVNGRD